MSSSCTIDIMQDDSEEFTLRDIQEELGINIFRQISIRVLTSSNISNIASSNDNKSRICHMSFFLSNSSEVIVLSAIRDSSPLI